MTTIWSQPNQQVVREDQSGPGIHTDPIASSDAAEEADEVPTVEEMTKAQLLDYAANNDIDVDEAMTKAEIRETIAEAETG